MASLRGQSKNCKIWDEDRSLFRPTAPPLSTISESNPITGLSLEDDYNWRIGLSVGAFVDAKDKNGNWYQVSRAYQSILGSLISFGGDVGLYLGTCSR
jgi:hypothetical protein